MNIVIAIDGPAGAGKSTISKIVAKKLNINYIDTGAMYRALTYKCLKNNINTLDEKDVSRLCLNTDIDFMNGKVYLDGELVEDEIRSKEVTNNVSNVAKIEAVRKILVDKQREIGKVSDVILDGRDVGTCIFPDSKHKFFLIATPEERGYRRYKELIEKGEDISLEEVIEDIKRRDLIDSTREVSPLIKADDAFELDTTNKTIDEVVDIIVNKVRGKSDEGK